MPRYDFHLTAEHLSGDDKSFVWDANFGGDLDVVDYGKGRASFVACAFLLRPYPRLLQ